MGFDDEMAAFKELQEQQQKKHLTPGCVWAIVSEVDWDNKTMTAIGIEDDLEYFDVQLGLGSFYRKPVKDTKVLLGVPGLQDSASFLIECEQYEEAIYVSGESTFVIKEAGFIVQQGDENLSTILSDYYKEFGKLCDEVNKIVVSIGTTPNVPVIQQIKLNVTQDIETRSKTVLKEN